MKLAHCAPAAGALLFCVTAAELPGQVKLEPGFHHAALSRGVGFVQVDRQPTDRELIALPAASFQIRLVDSPLTLGYTSRLLLVRIPIWNNSGETQFVLRTGLPRHGYTRLVQMPDATGPSGQKGQRAVDPGQTSGADLPFYGRSVVSNRPAFGIRIPPGHSELRLVMRSRDSLSAPIDLSTPAAFHRQEDFEHLWYGALFAALLIIGCYNLLIYISVRDKGHLYYTFLTIFAALYFAVVSGYSRRALWPDAVEFDLLMGFTMVGLYIASILLFARTFLGTARRLPKLDRAMLVLQALTPIVSLGAVSFSHGLIARLLVILALVSITLVLVSGVLLSVRRVREAHFFLAAFALFAAGTVSYALRVGGVLPLNFFTLHGIQIGSVAELLLLSFALADRVRMLQDEVRSRMSELQATHRRLRESEKRYRHLVEGSTDVIFLLDGDFCFESINGSLSTLLGLQPSHLLGRHFTEILYHRTDGRPFSAMVVEQRLRGLLRGEKVQFSSEWRTRRAEPRTMQTHLERIPLDDGVVYFGRAAPGDEDALLSFLSAERATYVITNYFGIGELLGDRLTRNLERYLSHDEALNLRLGLREVLVNAIEHGNLGISYAEKTAALTEGRYFEFLQERQADAQYADRTVRVDYSLSAHRAWFRVADQGDGFDHRAMSARSMDELNRSASIHGRGLLLTQNYFEVVRYNEKGNEVLLLKNFWTEQGVAARAESAPRTQRA